ncbi:MAG: hypothetical protein ABSE52_12745, partial [Candidatus Dormibacteria bacterium]
MISETPSAAGRMPVGAAWPDRLVEWRDRVATAETAVQLIRSGDRVWVQQGCGTPSTLLDALAARAADLHDV